MNRRNIGRPRPPFKFYVYAAVTFFLCWAVGYGLSALLYLFVGKPPEIWAHVIPVALSLGAYVLYIFLLPLFGRWRQQHSENWERTRGLMDKTIEAMDRIAQGDFSVFLPEDGFNPFNVLTESVNKMARELGTMENLRQDFISNVSHELQSPLTSISGFAALLRSDSLTREQRLHYIDVIATESGRLSKLSENLLRLSLLDSNVEPLTITEFSLDKQIQNAVLMLEPQWTAKDIDISVSLKKTILQGDEGLLTQVWINLLQNAVKFTPKGGKITVGLTVISNEAVCRISDTGIGFSEEDRMHIFERFYKADKSRDRALGGSGLGLSLVKKVVELHGGTVSAESTPDIGSTFIVTLPLERKDAPV